MKDLKVGIVGFGRIAAIHTDAWLSVSGVNLVSICDESASARDRAAAKGLQTYDSLSSMLEGEELDAVSICTPPVSHASQAIQALNYGVHVLCEKPLTESLATTADVLECAEGLGLAFQMATKFRHAPEVKLAKQLIELGEIGDPLTFHIEFASAVDMSTRWNANPAISGGGVIIDCGSHALDLVNFVFGSLDKVQVLPIKAVQNLPVEDQAMLLVSAGKRVFGEIMLSWSLSSSSDTYLSICGKKGTINLGWKGAFLEKEGKEAVKLSHGYDKKVAHHNMMEQFRDMALGEGEGWITNQEILTNATAISSCYASMTNHSWTGISMRGPMAA